MRSKIATKTPSSNGYGTSSVKHQTEVAAPAMSDVATLPAAYAPTLAKISSPSRIARGLRERGTNRYNVERMRGMSAKKYTVRTATTPISDMTPNTAVPAFITPENDDAPMLLIVSVI